MSHLIPSNCPSIKIYQANTSGTGQSYVDKKQVFPESFGFPHHVRAFTLTVHGSWQSHPGGTLFLMSIMAHGRKSKRFPNGTLLLPFSTPSVLQDRSYLSRGTVCLSEPDTTIATISIISDELGPPGNSGAIVYTREHSVSLTHDALSCSLARSHWCHKLPHKHQLGRFANSFKKIH